MKLYRGMEVQGGEGEADGDPILRYDEVCIDHRFEEEDGLRSRVLCIVCVTKVSSFSENPGVEIEEDERNVTLAVNCSINMSSNRRSGGSTEIRGRCGEG